MVSGTGCWIVSATARRTITFFFSAALLLPLMVLWKNMYSVHPDPARQYGKLFGLALTEAKRTKAAATTATRATTTTTGARRYLQPTSDKLRPSTTCPEDPFLWLITKDVENDGGAGDNAHGNDWEAVGFAVGTATMMDLPTDIAVSEDAWNLILNALQDSCTIYTPLNALDPEVIKALTDCATAAISSSSSSSPSVPSILDIPNTTLREQYQSLIREIVLTYIPQSQQEYVISVLYQSSSLIQNILPMIRAYNTRRKSYRDLYFEASFVGQVPGSIHLDVLQLGRPAQSMESVETHCQMIQSRKTHPTVTELKSNYYAEWQSRLQLAIDESYNEYMDLYQCGNGGNRTAMTSLLQNLLNQQYYTNETYQTYFVDRNVRISQFIIDALRTSQAQQHPARPFFAIGLAHWIVGGTQSLEGLLESKGYKLRRVTINNLNRLYDSDTFPDISDDRCVQATKATTTDESVLDDIDLQEESIPTNVGEQTRIPTATVEAAKNGVANDLEDMASGEDAVPGNTDDAPATTTTDAAFIPQPSSDIDPNDVVIRDEDMLTSSSSSVAAAKADEILSSQQHTSYKHSWCCIQVIVLFYCWSFV